MPILTALLPLLVAQASDFAWAEGETPARASAEFAVQTPTNFPRLLSGAKWLYFNRSKAEAPADGFTVEYALSAPTAGTYEGHARVGFEYVRSPFEWRLNGGPWNAAPSEKPTRHPTRLGTWMEIGWLDLGPAELKAGENRLELKYGAKTDGSFLAALDCVAFTKPGAVLDGPLQPGQAYSEPIDEEARKTVFKFPAGDGPERRSIELRGAWEVARYDDPNPDAAPYEPVQSVPSAGLNWQGVAVPGDAWSKPELHFASRLIFRTRVDVPADQRGRSFHLHFSGTTWIASVFVNGLRVGAHQSTLVPWDMDITEAIRPGETNEIAVAIKGPYYAMDVKGPDGLIKGRNLPREQPFNQYVRWVAPIYPSSKGEGDGSEVGLVNPVTLVSAGPAYVADAFVRSKTVADKRIDADVELTNPTPQPMSVETRFEILDARTRQAVAEWTGPAAQLAARATQAVATSRPFPEGKPWWPVRNPDLYLLRTTVSAAGKPIDVHEQSFGFIEVQTDGRQIRLNGVARNFWNWVSVSGDAKTPEAWLDAWEKQGNRFHRFAKDHVFPGVPTHREAQLDWADRNGVPGRLSTCIDGMFITYNLDNPLVWKNFGEHLTQVAKAYRNHPSVIVHSVENELIYINAQNTGQADMAEPKMLAIIQEAMKVDPTRPYMVDGGGALKGNLLPVDCPHYPEGETQFQPDNAYTFDQYADHSKRWPWDRQRPIILGETFFYAGKLEDQAWIGGDTVFRGRQYADLGAAKYARNLIEGFRWQEVAGICPWVESARVPGAEKAFSSLAAFTLKRGHRIVGGQPNSILVKVFNDTLSAEPVQFEWQLLVDGKAAAKGSESLKIEPGFGLERTLRITPPAVSARKAAVLRLAVSRPDGKDAFTDDKPVSVVPGVGKVGAKVLTFDPGGKLAPWLKAKGVDAKPVQWAELRTANGLLLVGPDALTPDLAYSPQVLGFASRGNPVVVLEQRNPLAGPALPIPIRSTDKVGGYAFSQAPTLPAFRNLGEGDFEDWAGSFPTYRQAYLKPSGNARCLVQAGEGLNYAPLLEVPAGQGVLVLCQLRVGEKLGVEPAADILLANLIRAYGGFRPSGGQVAVVASPNSPIAQAVKTTGVLQASVAQPASALDVKTNPVAVIDATKANLEALAGAQAKVKAYQDAGGWLVLANLAPDGLAAFNRLAGQNETLRPFRVERVTLEHPEAQAASTLGNRDLAFYSPQEIMFGDYWLSEHVYTHVVGALDAAPFMRMPGGPADPLEYKPTFSDNDPFNFVNGLTNSDSWRTIRQLWVPEQGDLTLEFGARQPETIAQVNVWNNLNYSTIERMDIVFDGDEASAMHVVLPDHDRITEFKVDPPRKVAKGIQFVVKSWRKPFQVRDGAVLRLVGIDNVQFLRPSLPAGKVPLDNVGGLVAYPRGKGGILLSQLKFGPGDPNPANYDKKHVLLTTLLRNLGAGSPATPVLVPGMNAEFHPIDITRWNNRYIRNREGQRDLFGEGTDLGHLVAGERFYGDIPFLVSNYTNAPVPQGILVGNLTGSEAVRGIDVGRTVDSLFVLHVDRVQRPIQDWERREGSFRVPEVATIVAKYADGSQAEFPLRLGEEVADWMQKEPKPLPNAVVAWAVPFPSWGADSEKPVVYASTWRNPKPGVQVTALDVVRGRDHERASVAILAITAANIRKP